MSGDLLGVLATVLSGAVATVVWLVRQEGRINVLMAQHQALKERVDGIEERILDTLARIESRLDKLAVPRP